MSVYSEFTIDDLLDLVSQKNAQIESLEAEVEEAYSQGYDDGMRDTEGEVDFQITDLEYDIRKLEALLEETQREYEALQDAYESEVEELRDRIAELQRIASV